MNNINEIEFPDSWDEVLPSEFYHILKLRNKLMNVKGVTLADIKLDWCRFVIQNRGIRPVNKQTDYYLLIYKLSQTLEWMWRVDDEGVVELTFTTTANLFPEWKNLRGPLSHGADLSFSEFRHAVILFNQYNETHEPELLDCLVGILYRKKGPFYGKKNFDGRYREDFMPARIDLYASRVRVMPAHLKYGVYLWFAYFCEYLLSGEFIVDGSQVCFAPVFERKKDDSQSDMQSIGMNSILFSIAESHIFGKVSETDEQPLLKIMLKLLDDKQRADYLLNKTKKS